MSRLRTDQFTAENAGQRKEIQEAQGAISLQDKEFKETGLAAIAEQPSQNFLSSQKLAPRYIAENAGANTELGKNYQKSRHDIIADEIFVLSLK